MDRRLAKCTDKVYPVVTPQGMANDCGTTRVVRAGDGRKETTPVSVGQGEAGFTRKDVGIHAVRVVQ